MLEERTCQESKVNSSNISYQRKTKNWWAGSVMPASMKKSLVGRFMALLTFLRINHLLSGKML
jgi:hypothetical protein